LSDPGPGAFPPGLRLWRLGQVWKDVDHCFGCFAYYYWLWGILDLTVLLIGYKEHKKALYIFVSDFRNVTIALHTHLKQRQVLREMYPIDESRIYIGEIELLQKDSRSC
jgi:hypothetical protein